jgi:hypothetical protein
MNETLKVTIGGDANQFISALDRANDYAAKRLKALESQSLKPVTDSFDKLGQAQLNNAGIMKSTWSPSAERAANSAAKAAGGSKELAMQLASLSGVTGPATGALAQLSMVAQGQGGVMAALRLAWQALPTAGLVIGIGSVIDKARELSTEIDRINKASGQNEGGFFGNLMTGWNEILGQNEAPKIAAPDRDEIRKMSEDRKRPEAEKKAAIKAAEDKANAVAKAEDAERRKLAVQSQIAAAKWEEDLRGEFGVGNKAAAVFGTEEWEGMGATDEERLRRMQIEEDIFEKTRAMEAKRTEELKKQSEERKKIAEKEADHRVEVFKYSLDKQKEASSKAKEASEKATDAAKKSREKALKSEGDLRRDEKEKRKAERDKKREDKRISDAAERAKKKLGSGLDRDNLTRREKAALESVRDKGRAGVADTAMKISQSQLDKLTVIAEKIDRMAVLAP